MRRDIVGRPMEVLLVEDNLEDARLTIELLQQSSVRYRATLVCDGQEAISFLRREGVFASAPHPDLVLLDMQSSKTNGHEVLTEIRAVERLKNVPVVVLTESPIARAILEGGDLPVQGFLTKPLDMQRFTSLVKSLHRTWQAEMVLSSPA